MKTRQIFSLAILAAFSIGIFASCTKNTEAPQPVPADVQSKIDLDASTQTCFFNLTTGEVIAPADSATTKWDVAFNGVNNNMYMKANPLGGSAQVVNGSFEEMKEAPESGYLPGDEAFLDYTTWAVYTGSTTQPYHAVLPKVGTTIALKTPDGKYAKIQVLSFYQGNPDTNSPVFIDLTTRPPYGFYSIKYAIQKDGSRVF